MPNQLEMAIHQFAGAELPRSPAFQRLEGALLAAADALAELPGPEFDRLCEGEAFELRTMLEYFQVVEIGDRFPPALTLGNKILQLFAAKYPALAQDGSGTA
jgi:hypothetical protein